MVIATGDTAKTIYKAMRKTEFAPQEIYDYAIPAGIVAIDRRNGDCAIAKRKGNDYVAVKGKVIEYLLHDLAEETPEGAYIKEDDIKDMITAANDVIYRK